MTYKLLFSLHLLMMCQLAFAQENTFKEFYSSGKLKAVKHEGRFNGCHMAVGTDSTFYESGKLKSTTYFDNRKSKKDAGCHDGWTIAISKSYDENERLKSVSQVKYSYEGTSCNCGTWITYDNKGRIIKKVYYGKCYDQVTCIE